MRRGEGGRRKGSRPSGALFRSVQWSLSHVVALTSESYAAFIVIDFIAIWSGALCPLPLGREDGGWMAVMGRPHRRAVRGYEDRRDRLQVLVEPELGV